MNQIKVCDFVNTGWQASCDLDQVTVCYRCGLNKARLVGHPPTQIDRTPRICASCFKRELEGYREWADDPDSNIQHYYALLEGLKKLYQEYPDLALEE